ncbi:hypothetical protein APED_06355 [Acanthopleuribacter pedis]
MRPMVAAAERTTMLAQVRMVDGALGRTDTETGKRD